MPEAQTYQSDALEDFLFEWAKGEIYHPKKTNDDRQTKTGDAGLDQSRALAEKEKLKA